MLFESTCDSFEVIISMESRCGEGLWRMLASLVFRWPQTQSVFVAKHHVDRIQIFAISLMRQGTLESALRRMLPFDLLQVHFGACIHIPHDPIDDPENKIVLFIDIMPPAHPFISDTHPPPRSPSTRHSTLSPHSPNPQNPDSIPFILKS